ncbi:unnamed protein product [Caenorhabditis sp. 36 PRJEB53466]|nr:unnamed protein product [Caenorhabditis sp. 36 PRJEB53466]
MKLLIVFCAVIATALATYGSGYSYDGPVIIRHPYPGSDFVIDDFDIPRHHRRHHRGRWDRSDSRSGSSSGSYEDDFFFFPRPNPQPYGNAAQDPSSNYGAAADDTPASGYGPSQDAPASGY